MIEVNVEIDIDSLAPLERYLAMDPYRMVQVAVAFLVQNPREIKDWITENTADDVTATSVSRRYLPVDRTRSGHAVREADPDEETGCLISRGTVNADGYALVRWTEPGGMGYGAKGRVALAGRAAFVHWFGDVPRGYRVTQTCGNRRCVAKEHVALKTGRGEAIP